MRWAGNLGRLPWRHEPCLDAILLMGRILARSSDGHDPESISKGVITNPVTVPPKYLRHLFIFLPAYDHSWHEPPITHFWKSSHQRALITYVFRMTYVINALFIPVLTKENPHIHVIHCVSFKQETQISTSKNCKASNYGKGCFNFDLRRLFRISIQIKHFIF